MTTSKEEDLPKPERLGIALIGQKLDVLDIKAVWAKVGSPEPLTSFDSHDAPIPFSRGTGVNEHGPFEFVIANDRVTLQINPRPGGVAQRALRLPGFHGPFSWILRVAASLIDVVPNVQRIGLHGSFFYDFDTADMCGAFIRSKLPFLSHDSALGEDLIFQVNKPLAVGYMTLNRLKLWQTSQARNIVISAGAPAVEAYWAARVSFDINNPIIGTGETLEREKCQQLLTELRGVVAPFVREHV